MSELTEWATGEVQRRLAMRAKGIPLAPLSGRGGWWPAGLVSEPYMGAWQRNNSISMDTAMSFHAVFACTTLIMSDLGKLTLRLVSQDTNGIWTETENPAFSPVLRKPNRYQHRSQFVETWAASKQNSGNVYALKQRDNRNIVTALYVLDPSRVTPLVAQDGSVYYELKRDDLSGVPQEQLIVPASEIIHDRMNCLFHPLMGIAPIFACALAAQQGISIQGNSSKVFANGSIPGGVLTAPGAIADETAARLKAYWDTNFTGANVGKVAVLGDGLKYEPMAYNAVEMELVAQLKLTAEIICTCYRVPAYMVGIGPPPPYANIEPLLQQYYSQCLQSLINAMELCLDEGLGLGKQFGNTYGTEFDPDDLIWLDSAAKSKAAQDGIGSGGMSPNEARKRYYALGPVAGGETPYMQNQMWPLKQLAERPMPSEGAPAMPRVDVAPAADDEAEGDEDEADMAASFAAFLHRKAIEAGLYAA